LFQTALNSSIDTILTSGFIIILITLVSGFIFMGSDFGTVQILLLIALGCLIEKLLSIFILPALIALFDRFVTKSKGKTHCHRQLDL